MNYYQRHLGDYAKDTGHLTLLEHGVYTVLLDWTYATEKPLPDDNVTVYRLCRATERAEKLAVDRVVAEFFPDRTNKRAQAELEFCQEVALQRRMGAVKKHHPDWTDEAVHEFCKSPAYALLKQGKNVAQAVLKQCKSPATRARSNSQQPTANSQQPFSEGGGGVQVGDMEILQFAAEWPGEPASGTPKMIPAWVLGQIKILNGRNTWPNDWKRWLIACWRTDFRTYLPSKNGVLEKKRAASPAQELFHAEKALESVRAQIFDLDGRAEEVPEPLLSERNELVKKIAELKEVGRE
jgi:uncharacterized protein YdaU (DUF1376 family)